MTDENPFLGHPVARLKILMKTTVVAYTLAAGRGEAFTERDFQEVRRRVNALCVSRGCQSWL